MTSAVSVTAATIESTRIVVFENQSSCCPLSSTYCSAPMPTTSIPMPQ
jgi:hypothetical protein